MNLEKMLEAKREFHSRLLLEKGLKDKNLFPDTILELQVELGEFANEGRWFKYWSNDQEPRTGITGFFPNTLLEEYADCVHAFLSVAIQKGWQDALYISIEPFAECKQAMMMVGKERYLTDTYLEMIYFLMRSYMEINPQDKKIVGFQINAYHFRLAWSLFMTIGIIGFGFTFAQIEQAYFEKNSVNHQRQESGY